MKNWLLPFLSLLYLSACAHNPDAQPLGPIEAGFCRQKCDEQYQQTHSDSLYRSCLHNCDYSPPTGAAAPETPQLSLSTEPDSNDLAIKQSLGASSLEIRTTGIQKSEPPGVGLPLTVSTGGREVLGVRVYLKNSAWPNNCILPGSSNNWVEVGPNSVNGLGWSSTGPIQSQGNAISVLFMNWSDCNARGGKLVVYFK